MPKAPRHRKRVRTARLAATGAPLGPSDAETPASGANGNVVGVKVGKKEGEVTNLIEKLKSAKVDERIWASSALASLLLELPAVTLRLLLSKNLIGLLIERLSDTEDEVVVECLGGLRNLAVSSPASILSEMHNKRLLLPLLSVHLPLLVSLLPAMLQPAPAPHVAPLPSTPLQREAADILNDRNDKRRRLYWDWVENVLTLLWCCAESNTKILATLNAGGKGIVEFLLAFLDAEGLGMDSASDMNVDSSSKKGKKAKKDVVRKERVPLFVAVAAAQTLHAFLSNNLPAQNLVLESPILSSLAQILATSTPPPFVALRNETHRSTVETDAEDFLTLRVLAFGIMLELTKLGKKSAQIDEMREVLKEEQGVLMGGLTSDLPAVAQAALDAVNEMPTSTAPTATPTGPTLRLAGYEKKLSTLQLSLEILGEWCASLDAEGLGAKADGDEEEWGGIMSQMESIAAGNEGDAEDGDDVAMDAQDEEMEGAQAGQSEEDDEDSDGMGVELSRAAVRLVEELPRVLLALATPTFLSFVAPTSASASTAPSLIPTSTNLAPAAAAFALPPPLQGIAENLTTIHVRALETLNNLYITLARSIATPSGASFLENAKNVAALQSVWEGTLELVLQASSGVIPAAPVDGNKEEEGEERRMEMVMAGVGAAWGMARVGLGESGQLVVSPQTAPSLVELFSHPFALAPTPAGEAIRVRIVGVLGWVGRRASISSAENATLGNFLLALLPLGKVVSPTNPTPEVLLQAIDSLIDLYSDEESSFDDDVFRTGGYLARLSQSIVGIRQAIKKIDKKKFPELRSRAEGALENLEGFIAYRLEIQAGQI